MAEKKYTRIVVEENNEHGFDSYRVPGIDSLQWGFAPDL